MKADSFEKVVEFIKERQIIVGIVGVSVFLTFVSPHFLSVGNFSNILLQISVNGLLSIGMTFVILTAGIDLSVGSMLGFGGIVAASFASPAWGGFSAPVIVVILVGMLAGAFIGSINGFIISQYRIPPFVVTLGMLSIARGATYIYSDGMPIPNLKSDFLFLGKGNIFGIPMPAIVFFAALFLSWLILNKTRFGRYVYAVGGNEQTAIISGVNASMIKFSVYTISGVLSSLGGMILAARTTAGLPQSGSGYELNAIGAVVIGGTSLAGGEGSLTGTFWGVLLIGIINNGLDLMGVSSYYQQVVKGAIIVLAVLIDKFGRGRETVFQ